MSSLTQSPTVRIGRNLVCLERQCVGPLTGGIKTSLGYFRSLVLAEARVAFGKTQGFHSTIPSQHCPRVGQCPGQSELPVFCLTVWHWTQEAGLRGEPRLVWEDAAGHLTQLPAEQPPDHSEKGYPGSTKAHVFLAIVSFIQQ